LLDQKWLRCQSVAAISAPITMYTDTCGTSFMRWYINRLPHYATWSRRHVCVRRRSTSACIISRFTCLYLNFYVIINLTFSILAFKTMNIYNFFYVLVARKRIILLLLGTISSTDVSWRHLIHFLPKILLWFIYK